MSSDIVSFTKDFIVGGVSATIAKTIIAPIERIKLILQVQHGSEQITKSQRYKGIIDAATRIPAEQGFLSLWRGNLTNIFRYFPTQAFNFAFKDKYKTIFLHDIDKDKQLWRFFLGNLAAGGAAGATSALIVHPLDYARTRLSVDIGRTESERLYKGLYDVMSQTVKSDGLSGLYRGLNASLTGTMIYRSAYFGLYDTGKSIISETGKPSIIVTWMVAQAAETFSGIMTYPLDTVKRRMMMQNGLEGSRNMYKNTVHCWTQMYKLEGAKAFYRGALTNMIRGTGAALVLVLYDEIQVIVVK